MGSNKKLHIHVSYHKNSSTCTLMWCQRKNIKWAVWWHQIEQVGIAKGLQPPMKQQLSEIRYKVGRNMRTAAEFDSILYERDAVAAVDLPGTAGKNSFLQTSNNRRSHMTFSSSTENAKLLYLKSTMMLDLGHGFWHGVVDESPHSGRHSKNSHELHCFQCDDLQKLFFIIDKFGLWCVYVACSLVIMNGWEPTENRRKRNGKL